jgi:hypothetical protein
MEPTLHEDAGPSEVHGLLYLVEDLLDREHVPVAFFGLALCPVEGAEGAGNSAHVRLTLKAQKRQRYMQMLVG